MQVLTKQDTGLVDKVVVQRELDDLKNSLDDFRAMIEASMESKEILELSKEAREATQLVASA